MVPFGISVSPDGSAVYVANSGVGTVSVINTATNAVTATITGFYGPVAFGNFISTYKPPTTTQTNVSCYGGNNGTATVTSVYGTPPYTYSLNDGHSSTANVFSGLQQVLDTIIITDSNEVIYLVSITITQPPVLTINVSNASTTCGTLVSLSTINNYTGSGTLAYNWQPTTGLNSDTVASPSANPVLQQHIQLC